ncbi:DEAD/DEAH box helicase [Alteribacter aurantiacus]|uniref:DEAD/DEAH box helicase n=1 Tax=Alteribacter aurantiacus TaxID=254410 RepID=UPI00041D5A8E|nr:DEAD/DEAH box helicase [Alteribacter aurantiacus]
MKKKCNLGLLQTDTESAWFIWLNHVQKREDVLLLKQRLFETDEPSFFGTAFSITETYNEEHEVITGIVVDKHMVHSLVPLFPEVEHWTKQTPIPSRFGRWTLPEEPNVPLFITKKGIEPSYRTMIDGLLMPSRPDSFYRLSNDHDERIRKWVHALFTPGEVYELPLHVYHYCLNELDYKGAPTFHLSLTIHEPDLFSDSWGAELFVTHREAKRTVPLRDVVKGDHPFTQNPVPVVKETIQTLSSVPALSELSLSTPKVELEDEDVYQFLQSYQGMCEEAGVRVLVPQSWEKPAQLSVTGEVSPAHIDGGASVRWLFSHHETSVPEDKIREWVDEQRHFIYFDNRWMHWDLQKASEYLQRIDAIRSTNRVTLFQAIQQMAYMPDYDQTIYEEPPEDTINWTLSDSWFEQVTALADVTIRPMWQQTLKSYQQEGTKWLIAMRKLGLGCCLADDMGLGKTVQAIAYTDQIERPSPVLIVCPTSLLENWRTEYERFAPELDVIVYYGSKRTRESIDLEGADIVLTTYGLLLRDTSVFQRNTWTAVLLDEAQMIKNSQTKLWKEAKTLPTDHRIAITGTPVENRLSELWSLFDWFAEGYLGSLPDFLIRFSADPKGRLSQTIAPFVLRRTKEQQRADWKLPEKTARSVSVELTKEQHLLYKAVVEETMEKMEFLAPHERKGVFFKGITRLKQICNHPAHFLDERHPLKGRSGKWEALIYTLDELLTENKRTVIFTQYKKMGYLIQEGIRETFGLDVEFLNGSMKMRDRYDLVGRFNEGRSAPVLLVSIRAGGTGLNITGATEVVHYDRWWNPAVDNQASDRVHRIGQTKPVTIHALTTKGTIEESIETALAQKQELYASLFGGERHRPVWEMNQDEVKSLFYGG